IEIFLRCVDSDAFLDSDAASVRHADLAAIAFAICGGDPESSIQWTATGGSAPCENAAEAGEHGSRHGAAREAECGERSPSHYGSPSFGVADVGSTCV